MPAAKKRPGQLGANYTARAVSLSLGVSRDEKITSSGTRAGGPAV